MSRIAHHRLSAERAREDRPLLCITAQRLETRPAKLTVMPNVFRRGRALWAVISIVAVATCGCNQTPTTPTPTPPATPTPPVSVASVAPAQPVQNLVAQQSTITGVSFRAGLVLQIRAPSGGTATVQGSDIQNLTPTSFQASVVFSEVGAYVLTVGQANGEVSAPFNLTVQAVPNPVVDSVSPSDTTASSPAQLVSLIGRDFDQSLIVQIIDPDSLLMQLNHSNLTTSTPTLIQFSMVLNKIGTYRISLWTSVGPASNTVTLEVR